MRAARTNVDSEAKRKAALENLKKANAANSARSYGVWSCAMCGTQKTATAHQNRQTYCSKQCMAEGYKTRMAGSNNANYKAAGIKTCAHCAKEYHSYQSTSVYCQRSCCNAAKVKPKPGKQLKLLFVLSKTVSTKVAKIETRICLQCESAFKAFPSNSRKYCTYACHLLSGGAFRAGIASARMTMKYGARKDANHNEIMEVLKKHCAVFDLSSSGCGVPDGIAYVNGGWQLFDIKNLKTSYGRRGLNPIQKKWIAQVGGRGGPVFLIHTAQEAKEFATGDLSNIKREGEQAIAAVLAAREMEAT